MAASAESKENPIVSEIYDHLARALTVLVDRAGDGAHIVDDKRRDLPKEGPLQDCEFGMILLFTWDLLKDTWDQLKKRNGLDGSLISEDHIKKVIVELTRRTIERVAKRQAKDEGGEDDDNPNYFFSAEPYTQKVSGRRKTYSANLDSVMLTLAFLIAAVQRYDAKLSGEPVPDGFPSWVKSLRDAVLKTCHAGVQYAYNCRVVVNKDNKVEFQGFTSDPKTARAECGNDPLVPRADRVFFTWTACETIRDVVEFCKSNKIANPPPEFLKLQPDFLHLAQSLTESAQWLQREGILDELISRKPPEQIGSVVTQLDKLGGNKLTPELSALVASVADYVQQVYQLAQYAAIRSLSPDSLTLEEVVKTCMRIDSLVRDIPSAVDESNDDLLRDALCRKYSLGKATDIFYDDDAYYPLVLRSLSGLLYRTLSDLVKRVGRKETLKAATEFRLILETHYRNLIKRRPERVEDKDLWSFAKGKEYVFYATQRTMYALICYKEFLETLDGISETDNPSEVELEAQISESLARSLAKMLMESAGKEIVALAKDFAAARGTATGKSEKIADGLSMFLEPQYAAEGFRLWVANFSKQFCEALARSGQSKAIFDKIDQCATNLKHQYDDTDARNLFLKKAKDKQDENKIKRMLSGINQELECYLVQGGFPSAELLRGMLFRDLFQSVTKTKSADDIVDAMAATDEKIPGVDSLVNLCHQLRTLMADR